MSKDDLSQIAVGLLLLFSVGMLLYRTLVWAAEGDGDDPRFPPDDDFAA